MDVCQLNGAGTVWTCDLDRNTGTTVPATASVVYNIGSGTYDAWGNDDLGNAFCCTTAPTGITNVELFGGPEGDDLAFQGWLSGGKANLYDPAGGTLYAVCDGRAGDDLIDGSDNRTNISETLLGGTQDDTIIGHSGNDTINGGEGDDVLFGGKQNDTMEGGAGDDVIDGDAGNDTIHGDAGRDDLRGGPGVDTIYGGDGDDRICGDGGADDLYGESGDDYLDAGPTPTDDLDGGGQVSNDFCTITTGLRVDCEAYFYPSGGGTCFF